MIRISGAMAAALAVGTGHLAAQVPPPPCCGIIAIDQRTGIVSAKVNATGQSFQFNVRDPAALARLRVGQAVYADFTTHRVSLDGRGACCTITGGPEAVPTGRLPVKLLPTAPVMAPAIPSISYGPPQPWSGMRGQGGRFESRPLTSVIQGRSTSGTILHLRGLDGIERAPGLPDGARRLLEMHVRTLKAGESDHYLVNTALAQQWIAAHPVPADVKPPESGGSGCKDWYSSVHCVEEAGQQVVNQASAEWQKAWQQAVDTWNHAAGELTSDWHVAQDCFMERTLPLPNIPVRFSVTPAMTVHLEQSGSKDLTGGGSASGTVQGTVGLGFPIQGDFSNDLDLFYIPCLPFVVRPKRLAGSGTLTVGERLTAGVSATGRFDKVFTIPPTGGPQVPIEVIPIIIGDVPVAELDISVYIEGSIEVGGAGKAEANFQLDNPHKAAFAFDCSGSGCQAQSRGLPDPTTTAEAAKIQGQVFVKPAIYTALQLDFDVDALSARAGPQPYLLGAAAGCAMAGASGTIGGPTTGAASQALAADLDWGVDLRAEALIARHVVGRPFLHSVTGDKHLWFRDLAPGGSTALVATVDGAASVTAGAPVQYHTRMPSCYPYTNPITYRIAWTGNGVPAANAACQWQGGGGVCTFDPTRDLVITLTWPAAGSYSLSVLPVGDSHHRIFQPAPAPTQVAITVGPKS